MNTPQKNMPKFNSISVSGYHMQEAGATADIELAYTLADGVDYVRAGIKAGLSVDDFAPRISFFWGIGNEPLYGDSQDESGAHAVGETDKRILSEKRKIARAQNPLPDFGVESDGAVFPYNNIVRTCTEAIAAVMGGNAVASYKRP